MASLYSLASMIKKGCILSGRRVEGVKKKVLEGGSDGLESQKSVLVVESGYGIVK